MENDCPSKNIVHKNFFFLNSAPDVLWVMLILEGHSAINFFSEKRNCHDKEELQTIC